jgi:hypothetical protein
MKPDEVLQRAYGSVPKEVPTGFNFDVTIFPIRPIKYFWLKWVVRKLFR